MATNQQLAMRIQSEKDEIWAAFRTLMVDIE